MRGYATMLEMVGQLNEQQTTLRTQDRQWCGEHGSVVNNLLDLGRIEAGIGLQVEIVPVQDVVERVVSTLQLQAAQKTYLPLSRHLASDNTMIEADQALLQQALHNLVENANQIYPPEGKVLLRVQTQPIGVVFQVIDNGIGISPMDLPRVFEKFLSWRAADIQRRTRLRAWPGYRQIHCRAAWRPCLGRKPAWKGQHILYCRTTAPATLSFEQRLRDKIIIKPARYGLTNWRHIAYNAMSVEVSTRFLVVIKPQRTGFC